MYWIKTLHTKAPYGYNLTDGGDGSTGNGNKRAVRCIDTGEIFESVTAAANKFELDQGSVTRVCQNKLLFVGGLKFEYVDAPLSEEAKSRKPNYFSESVRCLNTGEIFPSIKAAAERFGMTQCGVSAVCRAICLSINGLKFEYVDEEKRAAAEIKRKKISPMKKPVICLDTGTIYECAVEASKATGIYRRSISFACAGKHATAGGLHWAFLDEEKRAAAEIELKKITPRNEKPVRCIETNAVYPSIKAASEETGIIRVSISNVCRGKTKTAGGYHWRFVSED